YSKQVQIGDNNTALVVQNAFDDTQLYNDNNSALQVQTGDNNSAGLIQIGNTQNAWMIQDGDDSVLAVQAGRENDLVSKQYEGTNFMEIGQQGLANDLFAAQRGGQSFIGDQSGFQNIMEVLQVGPAGNLLETIDCDIPDPMGPMPLPEMENLMIPDITVPGLCADC
ncbi:curlin repeat-containing protein, partial [Cochleicola gelatinilyticus]|uniref:curlin repeat-containing protein n=1 Tax=Cochleicola gelatinilyticus TaxID=1763537 RepID=UPI0018D34FA7